MPAEVWLLGDPVSRSLSPPMQNAAFDALHIDCRYVLHEVSRVDLSRVIDELRGDERIVGANVTIPHKEAVIRALDALDPLARRIGAVNTISRQGRRLRGSNTDIEGFVRAAEECGYPLDGIVAILGAGGAARAVAAALQPQAREIRIVARNLEQARRLCEDLGLDPGAAVEMDRIREAIAGVDLIVNATPADLPHPSLLRPEQRVFDLRTRHSAEGRAMLLHQGASSFEIWTERNAPIDVMRAALQTAAEASLV